MLHSMRACVQACERVSLCACVRVCMCGSVCERLIGRLCQACRFVGFIFSFLVCLPVDLNCLGTTTEEE